MAFNATEQKAIDTVKELKRSNPEPNMAVCDQMILVLEDAGLAGEKTFSLDSIGTHPHLTAASHYLATDELTEEVYEVISSDTNQTHWPYPHLRSAE